MTGDELHAELYARQGFLVWCTRYPKTIGTVENENIPSPQERRCDLAQIPMRYVAESSRAEYVKQLEIIREIYDPTADNPPSWARYYYRVEAAD